VTYQQLHDWLVTFVAEVLEVEPAEIADDASWEALGVDSATVLVLVANLTATTGLSVRPSQVLEHPSIEQLAAHLAAVERAEAG
jgi:acyl carrier protein